MRGADIYAKHYNSTPNDDFLFMYFGYTFVKLLYLHLTMKGNYFEVNNNTSIFIYHVDSLEKCKKDIRA